MRGREEIFITDGSGSVKQAFGNSKLLASLWQFRVQNLVGLAGDHRNLGAGLNLLVRLHCETNCENISHYKNSNKNVFQSSHAQSSRPSLTVGLLRGQRDRQSR